MRILLVLLIALFSQSGFAEIKSHHCAAVFAALESGQVSEADIGAIEAQALELSQSNPKLSARLSQLATEMNHFRVGIESEAGGTVAFASLRGQEAIDAYYALVSEKRADVQAEDKKEHARWMAYWRGGKLLARALISTTTSLSLQVAIMAVVGMSMCHADPTCVDRIMSDTYGLLWTPGIYAITSIPFLAYSSITRWFRRYTPIHQVVNTNRDYQWKILKFRLDQDFWDWINGAAIENPVRSQVRSDADTTLHRLTRGSFLSRWFKFKSLRPLVNVQIDQVLVHDGDEPVLVVKASADR